MKNKDFEESDSEHEKEKASKKSINLVGGLEIYLIIFVKKRTQIIIL